MSAVVDAEMIVDGMAGERVCEQDTGRRLRPPRPYKAMLAICSDLDETPDRKTYELISRFLNTTDETPMGRGVGLEVGNTIYFDMPKDQFSYWNTDDAGRAMVHAMIQSGHIDCLHSFGDVATTRKHASRALDALSQHDCPLKVWIDHAVAPSNFGADIMNGRGDLPDDEVYHADLTCDFGIRYVWRGRVTSVIGQNVRPSLSGIYHLAHPVASLKTCGKELAKRRRAEAGDEKYAMHGPNMVMRDAHLRDGRKVVEFIRCNPHWGGVSRGDTAAGLGEFLTRRFLDHLVSRGGTCVLYTHLGKVQNPVRPFPEQTCEGLRLLASYYEREDILVTSTRRLLDWCEGELDPWGGHDGHWPRLEFPD